jgi:hypothetical protein
MRLKLIICVGINTLLFCEGSVCTLFDSAMLTDSPVTDHGWYVVLRKPRRWFFAGKWNVNRGDDDVTYLFDAVLGLQ